MYTTGDNRNVFCDFAILFFLFFTLLCATGIVTHRPLLHPPPTPFNLMASLIECVAEHCLWSVVSDCVVRNHICAYACIMYCSCYCCCFTVATCKLIANALSAVNDRQPIHNYPGGGHDKGSVKKEVTTKNC